MNDIMNGHANGYDAERCPVAARQREIAAEREAEAHRACEVMAERRSAAQQRVAWTAHIDERIALALRDYFGGEDSGGLVHQMVAQFVLDQVEPLRAENATLKRRVGELQERIGAEEENHALKLRVACLEADKLVAPLQATVETSARRVAELEAREVGPLRAENAALKQRCADLEASIDGVRDSAREHIDARIAAEVGKYFVAGGPMSAAVDDGWERRRADDRMYVTSVVNAEMRALERKLGELDRRVASYLGKLPVVKAWQVASVTYAGELVSHDGATWQARCDTAQPLGGADWTCIARSGRDAVTPKVRGAFDSKTSYNALDIVIFAGSAWIARREIRAGLLPFNGESWCQLATRGERGRDGAPGACGEKGETGEVGPEGERGERGERGEKGERGFVGIAGPAGSKGEPGETGPIGPRGDKGERGEPGAIGPPGERGERGEKGDPGEPGPAGPMGLRGARGERGTVGDRGPQGARGEKGDKGGRGTEGSPGKDGKLTIVKTFQPQKVHYAGEVVTHEGSTYQALRDTGQGVDRTDWICLARAGRDAPSPNVRGTYDAYGKYERLDIVALDGASFIAKRDGPGICPGEGWQLVSRQGKPGRRGEDGERGPRGERGDKGERGEPGVTIVGWLIDRERYCASPRMSDGTVGPVLELRGLFEQFLSETGD